MALQGGRPQRDRARSDRRQPHLTELLRRLRGRTAAGTQPDRCRRIAAHGQTIRHRPELGFTRQTHQRLHLLAELAGIDVIADFRSARRRRRRPRRAAGAGLSRRPCFGAARPDPGGGQHWRHRQHQRAARPRVKVTGFDTGPGNVLMDRLDRLCHQGKEYDTPTAPGRPAGAGRSLRLLAASCWTSPISRLPAPKSTGRDLFHAGMARRGGWRKLPRTCAGPGRPGHADRS